MTVLDILKQHLPPIEFFPVCLDFEQDDEAGAIFFQVQVLSFRLFFLYFLIKSVESV